MPVINKEYEIHLPEFLSMYLSVPLFSYTDG